MTTTDDLRMTQLDAEEGGIVRGLSYEDEIPISVLRDAIRTEDHVTYDPLKTHPVLVSPFSFFLQRTLLVYR